jgi:hypothetical protein
VCMCYFCNRIKPVHRTRQEFVRWQKNIGRRVWFPYSEIAWRRVFRHIVVTA